jgi:hypothetical protein
VVKVVALKVVALKVVALKVAVLEVDHEVCILLPRLFHIHPT